MFVIIFLDFFRLEIEIFEIFSRQINFNVPNITLIDTQNNNKLNITFLRATI